ncbi:uncharacterized protein NPIL_513151, partial [Nephila pilipes]
TTPLLGKEDLVTVFRRPENDGPAVPEKKAADIKSEGIMEEQSSGQPQDQSTRNPLPLDKAEDALKSINLASAITSYEAIGSSECPQTCCGVFGCAAYIWIKHIMMTDAFELLVTTLLFPWAIFIIYTGAECMKNCPMSKVFASVIFGLGITAHIPLVLRILAIVYKRSQFRSHWAPKFRKGAFIMEISCFPNVILHLVYHYLHKAARSNDSKSPYYCEERLYNYSALIIGVNMALMVSWVIVYICKRLRRNSN